MDGAQEAFQAECLVEITFDGDRALCRGLGNYFCVRTCNCFSGNLYGRCHASGTVWVDNQYTHYLLHLRTQIGCFDTVVID